MHMGGTEELAEQEKQPPDDGAEPLMLLAQLEGAHDHAGWSDLLVCLTLKERAVKQRVGGARWMVSLAALGAGCLVWSLAPGRGGDGLPRLPRAWCDPESPSPPAGVNGLQTVGTARPMA